MVARARLCAECYAFMLALLLLLPLCRFLSVEHSQPPERTGSQSGGERRCVWYACASENAAITFRRWASA